MATIYSEPLNNKQVSNTKYASVNIIGERTTNPSVATKNAVSTSMESDKIEAYKIIQSANLRFVTQDQIDKWNSVYKSVEQNNAINYRWQQSLKVTQEIIDKGNLIILPNNRVFYDLDSKSLMIFVNGKYIAPKYYSIINTNKFYFKNGVIKVNDDLNIIHLNRSNSLNNYDTNQLPLATLWSYNHELNEKDVYNVDSNNNYIIEKIQLNDNYLFVNPEDKHSILINTSSGYIYPNNYNIIDNNIIEFTTPIITNNIDELNIIQLSRVLPNENYIGYLWGITIEIVDEDVNIIRLYDYNIKNHAFSNTHDKSLLIFVDGHKISNNEYNIINSTSIEFENILLNTGSKVEIIQLGYTADISKLNDILQSENFKQIFNIDFTKLITQDMRNISNGYASINDNGYIDSSLINIQQIYEIIKMKLKNEGWGPTHIHYNMPILDALTADDQNQLCFNDIMVGNNDSAVIELNYNVVITAEHLANYSIELPYDCDTNRAIGVKFNGMYQYPGIDYIVIDNEYPIADKIYWKGYGMGSNDGVMRGDTISISYYKKKNSNIENNNNDEEI